MSFHATTILAIRTPLGGAMAGDGQVTFGNAMIMKSTARKVRRLYRGEVIVGFAGSVADAMTLSEKFEQKLEEHKGNVPRAAVELAKMWRTDRMLSKLEAMLIALSKDHLLMISGTGEVIEPDDGICAIGSGGSYALAAARALVRHTELSPESTVREALKIASELCVYTNENIIVEQINPGREDGSL
ncbi:ATP-dependent protease subunit HslV [Ferroacidibacillus organovorans]|uniref:ATP-dependent protease subunit HslV n=1 Tax=Ferroacidibacillus organovorans TaxID=1765683 RepID=A0A162UYC3_9BACL|nr:ATP-dependent protease subunit HslV [Ferroacidibacillus organovorans]KYP82145.1 HslU--HslV peptidase proteolytic subunit [Ferroacidibacillus organovorans]OAG94428.1 ATP-dependent protease subunit HslV [Ferroacidibacillus organovorans]OPG15686.1 HslU--HslV peptidase proteolytic subunit [Ferroacidibacillus organovorans]